MEQGRNLKGLEVERWFINFCQTEAIHEKLNISLKKLVQQLNENLYERLEESRRYLHLFFPDGNRWIDSLLLAKQEPKLSSEEKQRFIDHLLDSIVAIDAIVKVPKSNGQSILIAVDVTADLAKESRKVRKVKGLPESPDNAKFNRNKNIPKIRKWLGIDKHLVLVLNNQESLLPSREKLLAELQAFAESTTITGAVNLKQLARSETLAGEAAQQEKKRAFQSFLSGYLDAAVRSVIASLKKTELETTQPDGSVTNGPAIVLREDGTKSFKSGSFSWNLMPDNSVSITRLKDGSQITPGSATPREMDAIKEFVINCHEKFVKNQQKYDDDDDPPSQKQKPKGPRL